MPDESKEVYNDFAHLPAEVVPTLSVAYDSYLNISSGQYPQPFACPRCFCDGTDVSVNERIYYHAN